MLSPALTRWLFSQDNPSVRYLFARDLKQPRPSAATLKRYRGAILRWEPVQQLLGQQLEDGSFANPMPGFPAQTTYWALDLLARCGLDATDPPVALALARIKARHHVKGAFSYSGGGSGVLPCYVGVATRAVLALAGHDDPEGHAAIQWLVDHQRFDHKRSRAGGDKRWPYRSVESAYGGCWRSVSCYHGVVAALRAFTAIPPEHRSRAVQRRVKAALRYLEIHRVYRRTDTGKPISKHLTQFFFAGDYRSHLIDVLEGIAEADPTLIEQRWVRAAVDDVEALTDAGRVPLVKNYAKRLLDPLPFEPVGEPSRFLTLQWVRTKRRFGLV